MKRTIAVLLVIMAAAIGWAVWDMPELVPWPHGAQVVRPASAPAPTASGAIATEPPAEQQAAQGVEQVGEGADSATPLQELLPRQSEGHRQGLQAAKDPLRLHSSAAIVVDADTRDVLYAKNPDAVLPMASITKLMTGLVLVESKVPMDSAITITEDDMDKVLHSRSRLRVGSVLSRTEALHLALMSSENRAAHALARTYPGGLQKFIELMNQKARLLGMEHTVYHDPTGLSSDNKSTPRDLATLALAASKYPLLREFSTDKAQLVSLGNRQLQYKNSNALVRNGAWNIELQKTGYIVEAGHCVVMEADVHGHDLVMVLLDSDSNGRRNADAEKLRSWWMAQNGIVEPRKVAAKPEPKKEDRTEAKKESKKETRHATKADKKDDKKDAKKDDKKTAGKGGRVHAQFTKTTGAS